MSQRIVLVGHCGPDSSYLKMAVGRADKGFQVLSADDAENFESLLQKGVDLVLLNRIIDDGFEETTGVEIIERYAENYPKTKFMLISNYPEAHAAAVAAGGVMGFGKRELGTPKVSAMLHAAVGK